MCDKKWRPVVFISVLLLAFTLILFIFFHRSNERNRICPHPNELLFIDKNTGNGTCYKESMQGPCQDNMTITRLQGNSSVGICDCDLENHDRGLVYHQESEMCFFIFTQAYCSPGEWLKPYKDGCEENLCAKCEKNPCITTSPYMENVQLKDGTCVSLGEHYPKYCKSFEDKIHFAKYKVYPTCEKSEFDYPKYKSGGVGVPATQYEIPPVNLANLNYRCPKGTTRSHLGYCAVIFEF